MVPGQDPILPAIDAEGQVHEAECRCAYCDAETHQDVVKAAFWGPRGLVVIEDIPARVCEGCGEQFYSGQAAQTIEQIIHGSTSLPKQEVLVPVYSILGSAAQ